MEQDVLKLIAENGPMSGAELWEQMGGGDGLALWRTCQLSKEIIIRSMGSRYLRLDRRVKGYARLSPSLLREFLTYSVVGDINHQDLLHARIKDVARRIEKISRSKMELAYRLVSGFADQMEAELISGHEICFMIAGDIVYGMAHDVPRQERSSGKLVNGSDIDLVVVVDDRFPDDCMKRLDDMIYQEKYHMLMTPHIREEIDYVVKRLSRVREQVRFDSFKSMVACKILREGTFLFGSEPLFAEIKDMLNMYGVTAKLDELERCARIFRREAAEYLISAPMRNIRDESMYLFYPVEESEEFE